jgi:xylose dehydrogenase (NAD/NADP)
MEGTPTPTHVLRWGILSTASILKHFVPAVSCSPINTIVAVASRTQEAAQACATQYGIPVALGSYDELLARPDVDAVYIPLPTRLHREWVIRALDAGKHVLVEKPIALTCHDVDEMFDAARRNKRSLAEGYMSLHTALHRHLVETFGASRGAESPIGSLISVRTQFSYPLSRHGFREDGWRIGGGSLWDVGCYCVAVGQALAGDAEPVRVMAVAQRSVQTGVDDISGGCDRHLVATVTFSNGVVHTIECGLVGPLVTACELLGTRGRAVTHTPFKPPLSGAVVEVEKVSGDVGATRVDRETVSLDEDATHHGGTEGHLYRWQLDRFAMAVKATVENGEAHNEMLERDHKFCRAVVRIINMIHEQSVTVDIRSKMCVRPAL